MKFKKIIMSAVLLAGCFTASAQQETATKEVFNPHWFVQAQMGGQYTLGEVKFGDLLSLNAQVAGGYKFSPVWALRLAVSGWQSKSGSDLTYMGNGLGVETWKYKYIAPTVDVTCNITSWILGYNPKRIFDAGILAGVGANIGWDNGEAAALQQRVQPNVANEPAHYMTLLWTGTKARFVGKFGVFADFHIGRRVDLGIEVNANTLGDAYNSKDANNTDWYFNALAGIKVNIGKVSKRVPVKASEGVSTNAEPVIVEKIVEKPVEKIVEKIVYKEPEATKREPLRRDIFFNIRGSEVSKTEMPKVEDVVAYMNKYPEAKVSITGYADKGTGNPKINVGYAKKRAQMVADILTKKYGIAASRITVDSKGDTVQPYEQNDLNRVSICIAE
jgi:outer membrane protein OmpA-like peptidoglycan-associated protein